jgi:hypothetical protein
LKKPSRANRTARYVAYRNEGLTLAQIGGRCGVTASAVAAKLKKANCCLYPSNPTNTGLNKRTSNATEAVRLRNNGSSNAEVAIALGISRERVRQLLEREGYHGKPDLFRQQTDPEQLAIKNKLRTNFVQRLRVALDRQGASKSSRTFDLVGCSLDFVMSHLEAQFLPGMGWDNWAVDGWHVDHIRPCASFDLTDPHQQRMCFHYSNLQPLWAEDNLRKGSKWQAA